MINLVVAVFIWGLSFALAKKALLQFSPFELVTLRLSTGALAAFFLARLSSKSHPSKSHHSKSERDQNQEKRKFIKAALILGVFEFAGTYILYTWSLSYLASGVVGTLTLLTPILTFLIGCSFGIERLSLKGVTATVISFVGAALCFPLARILTTLDFSGPAFFGFCLIMASNLLFAFGNVFISKLTNRNRWSQNLTAGGLAWGSLLALIASIFTPHSPLEHFENFNNWLLPLYLGIIATGLGFFLWNRGVSQTSAFPASLIGNFKGPLSVFWGVILLHENFDVKFFVGLLLLFGSTQLIPGRKLKQA